MNDFHEKIATEQSLGNPEYNPEAVKKKLENEAFSLRNNRYKWDTYLKVVFTLSVAVSSLVVIIGVFVIVWFCRDLPPRVLYALIGAAFGEIWGSVKILCMHLFPLKIAP